MYSNQRVVMLMSSGVGEKKITALKSSARLSASYVRIPSAMSAALSISIAIIMLPLREACVCRWRKGVTWRRLVENGIVCPSLRACVEMACVCVKIVSLLPAVLGRGNGGATI